ENETTPFTAQPAVSTGARPSAVGVEQLNSDFPVYIAVANQDANTVGFFSSDGTGRVTEVLSRCEVLDTSTHRCLVGIRPSSLVLAEVDGDSHSDVITANQDGRSISVLLSSRPAPTPTATAVSSGTAVTTPTNTATATRTPGGDCCAAHAGPGCTVAV